MKDSSVITRPTSTIPGPSLVNYFDAIVGYTVPTTNTRLSLVVTNLFDHGPVQVGSNPGITNAGLYTLFGRTYLLTVDQKF